jgi:hypothetical protein
MKGFIQEGDTLLQEPENGALSLKIVTNNIVRASCAAFAIN